MLVIVVIENVIIVIIVVVTAAAVVVAVGVVLFYTISDRNVKMPSHAETKFNKSMRVLSHLAYTSAIFVILLYSKCN